MGLPSIELHLPARPAKAVSDLLLEVIERHPEKYRGILAQGMSIELTADGSGLVTVPLRLALNAEDSAALLDALGTRDTTALLDDEEQALTEDWVDERRAV